MKPDPTKPKKAGYVPAFFDPLFLFFRIRVDLIPEFVLESEEVVRGYVEISGYCAKQFESCFYNANSLLSILYYLRIISCAAKLSPMVMTFIPLLVLDVVVIMILLMIQMAVAVMIKI